MFIGKDYLHDDNKSGTFQTLICANFLLRCIVNEVIRNSSSIP